MIMGGLQSWSAHFGEEKNLSSLLGFKPQTVQPIAHSPYPPHHLDSYFITGISKILGTKEAFHIEN
jgi:hypothetical protein